MALRFNFAVARKKKKKPDCSDCSARKRTLRNCYNHKQLAEVIIPAEQWDDFDGKQFGKLTVEKFGDLALFECPVSLISRQSVQLIELVHECTDEHKNWTMPPFPGGLLDQPTWVRQARRVVIEETAADQADNKPG